MADNKGSNIIWEVLVVLQIVFFILKLCGVLTWSWVLIFIPTYILGAFIVILLMIITVSLILVFMEDKKK